MSDENGPESNIENQRRHPRASVRVEIFYSYGSDFVSDYMLNVSRGGLFVETFSPQEIGTEIELRFSLPAFSKIFNVKGKVVWKRPAGQSSGPPGMGIQFAKMDDEDARLIDRFVKSQIDPT